MIGHHVFKRILEVEQHRAVNDGCHIFPSFVISVIVLSYSFTPYLHIGNGRLAIKVPNNDIVVNFFLGAAARKVSFWALMIYAQIKNNELSFLIYQFWILNVSQDPLHYCHIHLWSNCQNHLRVDFRSHLSIIQLRTYLQMEE